MTLSRYLGRLIAVTGALFGGTLFFFLIIGVFGLQFAISGLIVFVLAAVAIERVVPLESEQL